MENQMNKKFWDIKASADEKTADLFIYGAIISGYKWRDEDITLTEFKDALDALPKTVKTLNMYVNSPGGSVFTTVAMINQLERIRSRVTIDAYVDGIAASCASFLIMKADNIYMYENTFLMLHKPMGTAWMANSIEFREQADWLDKVEERTCIPAYKEKGTTLLTDEKISELLDGKDNWLDANEAAELFNITILSEEKDAVACADIELLQQYQNVPKHLFQDVQQSAPSISAEEMALRQKIKEDAETSLAYHTTILGGIL